jgi:diguanylate cyclase (GGDEF)-like protein
MTQAEDAITPLRERFLRNVARRIEEIAQAIDLAAAAHDSTALADLRRRVHNLGGLGTTFGYPEVTSLAREIESRVVELTENHAHATAGDIAVWRSTLTRISTALEGREEPASPQLHPHEVRREFLIVDEDASERAALVHAFTRTGATVSPVASRQEALTILSTRTPDVLIVEAELPDGRGYDVVESLRSQPGGELTTAIVTSTATGFLDKVEAIRCGADAFFTKPYDMTELVRRIENLLGRNESATPRILYVEDDPDQAAFAESVLMSGGYEVRICGDPSFFDSELAAFRPNLILMDIMLPGVEGYELAQFVRQHDAFATTPIIFLSTLVELQSRIRSLKAGGDDYLIKPVAPGLLLATVAARIERARYLNSLLERDGLTGLLTHTAFAERMRRTWTLRERDSSKQPVMIMIDIDHFKEVNDEFGHPVGDRVLVALSTLLKRRVRQSDTIGRYGGEEFAIVLDDLGSEQAATLVSRIREEFARINHESSDRDAFNVTFSAGVAALDRDESLEDWKRRADRALYRAKAEGRNRVALAD